MSFFRFDLDDGKEALASNQLPPDQATTTLWPLIPRSTASRPTRDLRASLRQLEHKAAEPNEEVGTSEGFGHRAHVFKEPIGDDDGSSMAAAAAQPLPAPIVLLPQPPVPLQHKEGLGLVI